MPLADGYLVDADRAQSLRGRMLFQQTAHVALLHAPDLIPAQVVELGYTPDGHLATKLTDVVLEPLREPGGLSQPGKRLSLHGLTMRAGNPAILEPKINAGGPGIQIPDHMSSSIPKTG